MFKIQQGKVNEAWESIAGLLEEAKSFSPFDPDYAEAFGRAMTLHILGIDEISPSRTDSTFHSLVEKEKNRREESLERESSVNLVENK